MSESSAEPARAQVAPGDSWDFGLHLLRHPAGSILKSMTDVAHAAGWGELDAGEGERWLRNGADNGDVYAMERLGLRLCTGDGMPVAKDEGLHWLRKAAELGNFVAMIRMADVLLDSNSSQDTRVEAEQWHQRAIAGGYTFAQICLGCRLIAGHGLRPDPDKGLHLLTEVASRGIQLAHFRLAAYLIEGIGIPQNRESGLAWLRRIGIVRAGQVSDVGFYLYLKSLSKPAGGAAQLVREAAALFREAAQQGFPTARLNLGYLVRRGDIYAAEFPPLHELLQEGLATGNSFAIANQALRLAAGVQCEADWKAADALIGELQDLDPVLSWWRPRSEEGDAEGHLVLGWLGRHGLLPGSAPADSRSRLALARRASWAVPEWLVA